MLTVKQSYCKQVALRGHNLFVTGQAGTGKTTLLRAIADELKDTNKTVHVTCTTGIATQQFQNVHATTIHYWAGVADGRFTTPTICNKIVNDEAYSSCLNRLKMTDILIIDEISMLSQKLFNQINDILMYVRQNNKPYGGIQVIAGGSFKQLAPIPNRRYLDAGAYCFESDKWSVVFPQTHSFILEDVLRTKEPFLITAIGQLENGNPSVQTEDVLKTLNRPLPPNSKPTHLYATREDVDFYNRDQLNNLPGVAKTYVGVDSGVLPQHESSLRVKKYLTLKVGAPIILGVNLNIEKGLVNGARGKVISMKENSVVVNIMGSVVEIKPQQFSVYDSLKKRNVCSRTQLGLLVGYAMTIHKAQGMTLPQLHIDCGSIFGAGQLGVAVGRATSITGLRIVNYNSVAAHLKHPECVTDFYRGLTKPIENDLDLNVYKNDLKCCREQSHNLAPYTCTDIQPGREVAHHCQRQFATVATADAVSLPLPCLEDIFEFSADNPVTPLQSEMVYIYKNVSASNALALFWNRMCRVIEGKLPIQKKPSVKDWNIFTASVHEYVTTDDYSTYATSMYTNIPASTKAKNHLAFKLFRKANEIILSMKCKAYIGNIDTSAGIVSPIDDSSKAVIRYVAGYTVVSLRRRSHSDYAKHAATKARTRWSILRQLSTPYEVLLQQTEHLSSLSEITRRTTALGAGSGLTCVKDSVYLFFIDLYIECVKYISLNNMLTYQSHLFQYTLSHILNNAELYQSWFRITQAVTENDMAEDEREIETSMLVDLFEDICEKFLSIVIVDARKNLVDFKGKSKSLALRKGIKAKSTSKCVVAKNTNIPGPSEPSTSTSQLSPHTPKCDRAIPTEDNANGTRKGLQLEDFDNMIIDFPCGKCGEDTDDARESVECSYCQVWYHYGCNNIKGTEVFITNPKCDYYCPDCDISTQQRKKPKKRKLKC